jgi:hypothetical protein
MSSSNPSSDLDCYWVKQPGRKPRVVFVPRGAIAQVILKGAWDELKLTIPLDQLGIWTHDGRELGMTETPPPNTKETAFILKSAVTKKAWFTFHSAGFTRGPKSTTITLSLEVVAGRLNIAAALHDLKRYGVLELLYIHGGKTYVLAAGDNDAFSFGRHPPFEADGCYDLIAKTLDDYPSKGFSTFKDEEEVCAFLHIDPKIDCKEVPWTAEDEAVMNGTADEGAMRTIKDVTEGFLLTSCMDYEAERRPIAAVIVSQALVVRSRLGGDLPVQRMHGEANMSYSVIGEKAPGRPISVAKVSGAADIVVAMEHKVKLEGFLEATLLVIEVKQHDAIDGKSSKAQALAQALVTMRHRAERGRGLKDGGPMRFLLCDAFKWTFSTLSVHDDGTLHVESKPPLTIVYKEWKSGKLVYDPVQGGRLLNWLGETLNQCARSTPAESDLPAIPVIPRGTMAKVVAGPEGEEEEEEDAEMAD